MTALMQFLQLLQAMPISLLDYIDWSKLDLRSDDQRAQDFVEGRP